MQKIKSPMKAGPWLLGFFAFVLVGSGKSTGYFLVLVYTLLAYADSWLTRKAPALIDFPLHAAVLQVIRTASSGGGMF